MKHVRHLNPRISRTPPPSLHQICDTRSNNDYLRPSYTPTNTQNNLISHTLLWVVTARRTVLAACGSFVLKRLWEQLRVTSWTSAPPARNNSPRTPHRLPVTQNHRIPCVRPMTQGSQAVAGWRVGGLVMASAGRREETWRKIRYLRHIVLTVNV